MKQAGHNNTFTAADIQRYYAGEMSMQERHALEKAALDDPFLADALEGYQHTPTPQADLSQLEQQLAKKAERKRTYPLLFLKPWMRVAALFLLLAGAGWTVYQFTFTRKENLAIQPAATNKQQEKPVVTNTPAPPDQADSAAIVFTPAAPTPVLKQRPQANTPLLNKPSRRAIATGEDAITDEENNIAAPVAVMRAPVENKVSLRETEAFAEKKEVATASTAKDLAQPVHTFKGKILDAKGNPVANASIMVKGKPTGTTTNKQGQFFLTTPDTVLNATIAAIGFETNRVDFKDPEEEKTVVLNESSAALNEVVVTAYGKKRTKNNRPLAAQTKAEIEELEPENGWSSFNNYISQNIQVPEEVSTKQIKGEVELSFDVNKNGEPVNIKVEKSLCTSCDNEAIRLLKEGPEWKKKKRKNGKVKIRF